MAQTTSNEPHSTSSLRYDAGGKQATRGNGSGWILAVSVLQVLGTLFFIGQAMSNGAFNAAAIGGVVVMGFLALVFFGLWLWGRKSPAPAISWALGVFITVHLLDAIVDPISLFRGLPMKVIVIAGLIVALIKARRKPLV